MSRRPEQVAEAIAHYAAEFFARESNGESLITVTRADLSPDFKNAIIFISVLPVAKEQSALAFAKRVRTDMREYLQGVMPVGHIPTLDVALDFGEKNRQRIDDLTRS
jgi:ribosome-binding factor A